MEYNPGLGVFEWRAPVETGTAGRLYDKDGVSAWYPASGLRERTPSDTYSGALAFTGIVGWYTTGSVGTGTNALRMQFRDYYVIPSVVSSRGHALPTRCIRQ